MGPNVLPRLPRLFVLWLFAVALILMSSSARAQARGAAPTGVATAVARVSHADENGVRFELRLPPAEITAEGVVSVPGLQNGPGAPGSPDLPAYHTFIAVPPAAEVSIRVTAEGETLRHVARVQPVPKRALINDGDIDAGALSADTSVREAAPVYAADAAYYGDAFFPAERYTLSAPQIARDMRLVQLTLYPVRYSGARQMLAQAQTLQVELIFSGAQLNEEGAARSAGAPDVWRGQVLNDPPQSWRLDSATAVARPNAQEALVTLPLGVDAYKIEVVEDGIYEISGADLAAAGMDLDAVNVNRLEMMHRGQTVAFQFVDVGGRPRFEAKDKIRFYGWAFDGSRYEDMFTGSNYYWLWARGTPTAVTEVPNGSGPSFQAVNSFPESITNWEHRSFYGGGQVNWDESPNEATPWHLDRISGISQASAVRRTYSIDLPDPVENAAATVTAEFTSRLGDVNSSNTHTYEASSELNEVKTSGSVTWQNHANVNAVGSVPGSTLLQPGEKGYPTNRVRLTMGGSVAGDTGQVVRLSIHVTRISVNYERRLLALDDALQFGVDAPGAYAFPVDGFSENKAAQALVWDVSDRLRPEAIALQAEDVSGSGAAYRWTIRRTLPAGGQIFATTAAELRSPRTITRVVPQALAPAGGAKWLAISHESLLPAAEKLAAHRATQSGLSTWVIDVQQIIDQVGYGYHLPTALQAYLREALATWDTPPVYVTLFGDATVNPRHLTCSEGCGDDWDADKPHLLATDLLFADRFAGLIPVDYTYSLLAGDDLLPDIAIARVPAQNRAEANNTVANIMRYEQNNEKPSPQRDHFLFVADNPDGGGNFCAENAKTVDYLPPTIRTTQLCLQNGPAGEPPTEAETAVLRQEMFRQINDVGLSILNYRGHGSISYWAGPIILEVDDRDIWQNVKRPVVLLSADCLDGNFTAPNTDGLGETFVRLDNERGTAAHWSSSGLGYTFEHTPLHLGFYEAVFKQGMPASGDAVNFAKTQYLLQGYDVSEALAFTLLGDPAMVTYPWSPTANIPVVLSP